MEPMFKFPKLLLAFCFVTFSAMAGAAGDGEYRLDWPVRDEVLAYHACGCADACWVAEVRDRRSHQRKARLRCDCEKAFYSLGEHGVEKIYAASCDTLNTEQKPAAIGRAMRQLLGRPGL